MQLPLYRSMTHLTYPDESFTYCYSFQPIHAEELCRDGHLACWTDDSGTEPFAVIEVPASSTAVTAISALSPAFETAYAAEPGGSESDASEL